MLIRKSAWAIFIAVVVSGCAIPKFDGTVASNRRALLRGEIKEALAFYETQAQEAERNTDRRSSGAFGMTVLSAYVNAADTARIAGQLQKAITYGEKALVLASRGNSSTLQLSAIRVLTLVYREVRNFEKARALTERGFKLTKGIADSYVRSTYEYGLYYNLGLDLLNKGAYAEASEALSQAYLLGRANASGSIFFGLYFYTQSAKRPEDPETDLVQLLADLTLSYRLAGRLTDAFDHYQLALRYVAVGGLRISYERQIYDGLGNVYLQQKQLSLALENFHRALVLAEKQREPAAISAANIGFGRALDRSGRSTEAVPYYKTAIEQIESLRSVLQSEQYRQTFFDGGISAYIRMVGALVDTGKADEAFDYSERARSRAFLDLLGSKAQLARVKSGLFEEERTLQERIAAIRALLTGEVDGETDRTGVGKGFLAAEQAYNAFLTKVRSQDKEQASLMAVEPLTLKQVQELIEPGQTLIEYFVTDAEVFVWLVEKDKLYFQRIALSKNDLAKQVKTLREMISNPGNVRELNEVSTALYKSLLQPLLPHITGTELIVVPHDVLHYLPFQALLDPDGKYLIEKYPISYLSSASLLQFVKEKRTAGRERVLAFGNPDLGDPEKNLEFAELEAQGVKSIYPDANVFVRKEATEEKTKALSANHDILHFATHAQLNEDDPLSSAVLLAKDGKEDGRLEVREIFGMDLKADLVVLSGCDTALGRLSTGDELVGLTRAFIYAGTPSVVASLWSVDDSSTAQLMASFYNNLKTMSKVEALRQAQLQLIRAEARSDLLARRGIGGVGKLGESRRPQSLSPDSISVSSPVSVSTSHPYFWAPFILVGNGK